MLIRSNTELSVRLESSVFPPEAVNTSKSNIYWKKTPSGKKLYKVYIYLKGPGLSSVKYVRYKLHPTFKRNELEVARNLKNDSASIAIWTWGLFEVNATVYTTDRQKIELSHELDYDKEIAKNLNKLVEV